MSEEQSSISAVEYREVPDTNGYYRAGSDGSIWTCWKRGRPTNSWWRLRSTAASKKRYLKVAIRMNGRKIVERVHVLVLRAFNGPCPDGMESRHLDGDKHNCSANNLAWGTPKQNSADKILHGTNVNPSVRGSKCWRATLTEKQVIEARKRASKGECWSGLAREFGVSSRAMISAISGTRWGWLPGAIGPKKRVKAILEEK
jgi:hypothetical protein